MVQQTAPPDNSFHPQDRGEWRSWLRRHGRSAPGVWLISWKKASGRTGMDYDEAVEEALCFGWIDSRPRKLDELRSMLWFAPRKAGSGWSAINKARVARAVATGAMTPAGQAKIDAAVADGSWAVLDAVDALEVPADLAEALRQHGQAREHFDRFPRSARRGILEWIAMAKTAATRQKRIDQTATLAATGQRANQWRP